MYSTSTRSYQPYCKANCFEDRLDKGFDVFVLILQISVPIVFESYSGKSSREIIKQLLCSVIE
ncbi:hypothetical protein N7492_010713 [Penicillium capsulatum]|uniref:Uncharacterized protein n=1 Tax=Penicillium capsulatum TaxID=69766 RepID=A0A9W9LDY6_9EURO|nr:hypothetical protein N7492_010713 [Penicillium capsulatum]